MRGYKAFKKDWKCRGMQYEIGKSYEMEEKPIICQRGYHFCENPIDVFGYYSTSKDILFAEVEAYGDIVQEGTKFVTNKIRIIKEFTREQLQALILKGEDNTGSYNTGRYNSGNFNSGYGNSGDHNSGIHNCGDCNSGNRNSGSYNSGEYNSGGGNSGNFNSGSSNGGDFNTGNYNSGKYNSGNRNSGCGNSGNFNSGYHNSGSHNIGDYNCGSYNNGDYNCGSYNNGYSNSGHYNSGNHNSGIFNTSEPTMHMFNKDSGIRYSDFINRLDYDLYRLLDRIHNKSLEEEDWERIKALPNYDADIFEQLTGLREIKINKGRKE